MKPVPKGWMRITSSLFYDDAAKAIDWLCEAFGFEVQLKVEGAHGEIEHSELVFGDGVIMVGAAQRRERRKSPAELEGVNTQSLMVYVDDLDAHLARARAAGAQILTEPKVSDYGEEFWSDRSYEAADLEGHRWWFCERLRSPGAPPPRYVKHD